MAKLLAVTHQREPTLPTLPIDLHFLIFALLEPHDIIQIRQTCKALQNATLHRIVWIEALRQICLRNLIYIPTFPIPLMSLSELEHASIVPHKWVQMCYSSTLKPDTTPCCSPNPQGTAEGVKPESKAATPPQHISRLLHCPESLLKDSMYLSEPLGEFNGFYLVPGGRFLVTFSDNWLAVWDLGINPGRDTIMGFQPLDAVLVRLTGMELVHATPDGQGLRIFVSTSEPVMYKDDVYESPAGLIYEIYPQSANPELELIARIDPAAYSHDVNFYSLSADLFIFMHDRVLKVWDYKLNAWASWSVEHDYDQIVVGENSIMLLYNAGVDVWPIPALTPISASQPQPITFPTPPPILKPTLSLPYPSPQPQSTSWCEGPCDWFSGTSQPYVYDLVCWDPARRSAELRRYEIVVAPDLKSGELVERRRFGLVNVPNKRGVSMTQESWVDGSWVETTSGGVDSTNVVNPEGNGEAEAEGEREGDGPESDSGSGYLVIQPSMFLDDKLATVLYDSRDNSIKVHLGSTLPEPVAHHAQPESSESRSNSGVTTTSLSSHDSLTLLTSDTLGTRPPFGMGFCPLSARLVYLDDEQRLWIVDYMPKPTGAGVTWLDMASGGRQEIVHDAVLEICD